MRSYLACAVLVMLYACEQTPYLSCELLNQTRIGLKNGNASYLDILEQQKQLQGLKAFNTTLVNLDSVRSNLYDHEGKVLVLNYWFTTCQPCLAEMPFLDTLKTEFEGQDVQFLSFVKDTPERITKYLSTHSFSWDMYFADQGRFELCVSAYPTTIVLDQDMQVVFYKTGGSVEAEEVKLQIDELKQIILTQLESV